MSLQDSNIYGLPTLPADANPAELWELIYFESGPVGSYKRKAGSQAVAANSVRGGLKIVRYLSSGFLGVPAGASALNTLEAESLTLLTEAWVVNNSTAPGLQPGQPAKYVLQPAQQGSPGALEVYVDANPETTTTAFASWQLVSSSPGGGSSALTADLTVSLSGGKTWGTIKNNDFFPAGTQLEAILVKALVETIYPTYTPASLTLAQTAAVDGEVGALVANSLTATFNRADAGAASATLELHRDATSLGSALEAPQTIADSVRRTFGTQTYGASISYAAGAPKLVQPGDIPDARTPAVRTANAPQAAEAGLPSNALQLKGWQQLWWAPVAAVPTTSAQVRALAGFALYKGGATLQLQTGTQYKTYVIILPPGATLQQVIDVQASNGNITAAYVGQQIAVNDANGVQYKDSQGNPATCTMYVLAADAPYTTNHTHTFTIA